MIRPSFVLLLALVLVLGLPCLPGAQSSADASPVHWPSFRGVRASGVSTGGEIPAKWNVETGENIGWRTDIAGLGLSSPIIWGDKLFVTTAVAEAGRAKLEAGLYGRIAAADDDGPQSWRLICLDKKTGRILWDRELHRGKPTIKRHTKASHANSTPATDGKCVVSFLGSEGLHCVDLDGKLLWKKTFGTLDSGYFRVKTAQWGFASSPTIYAGRVIVQCDVQGQSFLASLDIKTGDEMWRTRRDEIPTWSTPAIIDAPGGTQIALNGFRHTGGYDFATGKQVWNLQGGGDIPVPTPISAHGLTFITSAHGRLSPIYAIHQTATGEISATEKDAKDFAWKISRGGNYMQTPIVVGDLLFACKDQGIMSCFDARGGERHFQERLSRERTGFGFTASPVSDGKKIVYVSEDGYGFVMSADKEFKRIAKNKIGSACLASPAISEGKLFIRTRGQIVCVGR
ncbi:MAG: outer membrane protein assembly factor BamB [Candidatus Binatia bacterium]|jgi:outer membrane protein assembly factor BamB